MLELTYCTFSRIASLFLGGGALRGAGAGFTGQAVKKNKKAKTANIIKNFNLLNIIFSFNNNILLITYANKSI